MEQFERVRCIVFGWRLDFYSLPIKQQFINKISTLSVFLLTAVQGLINELEKSSIEKHEISKNIIIL